MVPRVFFFDPKTTFSIIFIHFLTITVLGDPMMFFRDFLPFSSASLDEQKIILPPPSKAAFSNRFSSQPTFGSLAAGLQAAPLANERNVFFVVVLHMVFFLLFWLLYRFRCGFFFIRALVWFNFVALGGGLFIFWFLWSGPWNSFWKNSAVRGCRSTCSASAFGKN